MVLAAAASALTACATNGGYTAYNGSHDGPKTIAILQPMNLESYTLLNQGGAGKMFGAIGALAEGPSDMAKMKQLDGSLKSVGFDFSTTFSQTLKSKLEAEGYKVVIVPVSRPKPMALVDDADQFKDITADAILDVAVWSVGYANINITDNDFRPDIKVDVSLKSLKGSKLYSETIMYGYHNPFMSATDIDSPKDYYFDNRDRLLENPEKAKEGLMKGVDAVTGHVAQRLGSAS